MSADANAAEALRRLVATLDEHLEAVAARRGDADAAVDDAYEAIATAFERYEEALDDEYGESLPLVLDDSDGDEYDDTDEDAEPDGDPLDPHAVEDDDDMDDDIEEFDLR